MELGALICMPRNPQCQVCPAKKLCVAFRENRVEELPNLGKRTAATAKRFMAFVIEQHGRFLVRQRPAGLINAHLWEFPNVEVNGADAGHVFESMFGTAALKLQPFGTVKHSITRYRITLEAFAVRLEVALACPGGVWKTPAQMRRLAFTAAHKKLVSAAIGCILSGR